MRDARIALPETFTSPLWGMTECGIPLHSFLDSSEDERCAGSGYPLPGYEFKVIVTNFKPAHQKNQTCLEV